MNLQLRSEARFAFAEIGCGQGRVPINCSNTLAMIFIVWCVIYNVDV